MTCGSTFEDNGIFALEHPEIAKKPEETATTESISHLHFILIINYGPRFAPSGK